MKQLDINGFTISKIVNHEGKEVLWIEHSDGEGMSVDIDELWREF